MMMMIMMMMMMMMMMIKAFVSFEKLIKFHWQAFIVYKNGENLKILIELFRQNLIVSEN